MAINPIFIGGFGNRLYQLANAFRLQDLYECDLQFHVVKPQENDFKKFRMLIHKDSDLDQFGGHKLLKKEGLPQSIDEIFPNLNWNLSESSLNKIIENKKLVFEHNVLQIDPEFDTVVMGYFFHYFFIKDFINSVKNSFNSKIYDYVNEFYSDLNQKNILGLHLRLGIETDNTPAVEVPKDFYLSILKNKSNDYDEVYVISDNTERAKEFIKDLEIDKPIKFIENEPMFIDLIILSKCKILIIAPSTLSAWSAYLKDEQENIFVPYIWKSHHWTEDIPNSWNLL